MQTLRKTALADVTTLIVSHRDQAGFLAAGSRVTTLSFQDCGPDTSDDFTEYPEGLSRQGITFTAICRPDFPSALFVYAPEDTRRSLLHANGVESLNISLPLGTTAFSAEFWDLSRNITGLITAVIDGFEHTFHAPCGCTKGNRSAFVGITSSLPISRMTFRGDDYGPILDRVSFGLAHAHSTQAIVVPTGRLSHEIGVPAG
ncbi:MAG: hypothetical protein ACRYFS_04655 [Janthinobacterium lividum]